MDCAVALNSVENITTRSPWVSAIDCRKVASSLASIPSLAAANANDALAAAKLGIEASELATLRQSIADTQGDLVVMFSTELSATAQSILAQLPYTLRAEGRRVLLHPLPLY